MENNTVYVLTSAIACGYTTASKYGLLKSGKDEITLKAGETIGSLSEIEAANVKFDLDVENYKPLDLKELANSIKTTTIDKDLEPMISNNNLTKHERLMLSAVLLKHKHVFQWDMSSLGRTKQHHVPTGTSYPGQRKQYPILTVAIDEIRKQQLRC